MMANLYFRSGIEEEFALPYSLLPFQQYGYAEEEVAEAALAVMGIFIAGSEYAATVSFQQGVVAVHAERTVTPIYSGIDAPMRVLLELMTGGQYIETELPRLRQVEHNLIACIERKEVA